MRSKPLLIVLLVASALSVSGRSSQVGGGPVSATPRRLVDRPSPSASATDAPTPRAPAVAPPAVPAPPPPAPPPPAPPPPAPPPPPQFAPVSGFDFSPYTVGDAPGAVVPDSRIIALLSVLRGKTGWIKIGGSTGGMTNVPRIARSMGFKVAATAYLNGDTNSDASEVHQLEADVIAGYVDLALVGSEAVWIKAKTADALAAEMDQVRADTGRRVPVGTTEPDQAWFEHPGLAQHADVVVANITPFSFHIGFEQSLGWLQDRYGRLQQVTGKPVYIGETEWASDGGYFNPGGPTANLYFATHYFAQVEHWARPHHVIVFYFEAFDEPWLSHSDSVFGPHWGVFTSQGVMKPGMEGGFQTP